GERLRRPAGVHGHIVRRCNTPPLAHGVGPAAAPTPPRECRRTGPAPQCQLGPAEACVSRPGFPLPEGVDGDVIALRGAVRAGGSSGVSGRQVEGDGYEVAWWTAGGGVLAAAADPVGARGRRGRGHRGTRRAGRGDAGTRGAAPTLRRQ